MRASHLRYLRWVAIPVRSPWSWSPGRAHSFRDALQFSNKPVSHRRCFSVSPPTRLIREGNSTIYALSTAPGRAAIAVVRVSGPDCVSVYEALCPKAPLPRPRVAAVRTLYEPSAKDLSSLAAVLDAGALVLYFPGPRTVTGEDVLELHLHGGPAIVRSVLTAIESTNGDAHVVRYAEPGEFTRRAFMNNRLDLPQIEALGHTLTADTEQQRRLAVRGASDALSKRYEDWRQQLLYARGELEALIDFSEDQHFDESPDELVMSVASQVRALSRQIALHIQNASKGELMRNGIKVALLGAPNAGKSSLLNRIVGREAAIVSTEEGTTRDIVDVGIDLGGWYCKLGDMAGIRSEPRGPSKDKISVIIGAVEKEGIRRARARALESDVVVVVISVEDGLPNGEPYRLAVEPDVVDATNQCVGAGKHIIVAINKCDRLPLSEQSKPGQAPSQLALKISQLFPNVPTRRVFGISCLEAANNPSPSINTWSTFLQGLISTFEEMATPSGVEGDANGNYDRSYWEDSLGVTHRQSSNLQRCLQSLGDFLAQCTPSRPSIPGAGSRDTNSIEPEVDIVTAAEHLRFAADALALITGKGESGDVEDVLGVVFEKFCVGK
ncbi:GTP-binding protein TrmE N-terminus-domain-containing protein [Aspergillus pseudoustus]|uniref:GTP-binding protein TrmE N-terminus-domain-containing protein n=1 Tax=Aspergillus pseudoustus TaxID=1810923 RepID=A0ABR4KTA2_9EURO